MLIIKFKLKNFIKFKNKIKLITIGIFVLFNIFLFQSCATTDFCGGDPNLNPNTDCKPGVPQNLRFEVSSNTIYTIFWDPTDGLRSFNSENLCYSKDLELSADSLVWTQDGAPQGGSYTQKDWNDTFATVDYNPNAKCNFRVSSCGSLGCSVPSNILEFYMGAPAPLDFKIINLSSQNEKVIHEVNESKTVILVEKSFSFVWKPAEDLSYAIQFTDKFDDKSEPIWAANSYTQQVKSITESTLKYGDTNTNTNIITSEYCLDSNCEFSNTSSQNFGETFAYRIRTCLSSGERCGPYSEYIKVIIKAPALTNNWITITNSWITISNSWISVSSLSSINNIKINEFEYVLSWQKVEGLSSLLKYYIKECNAKDICNYESEKDGTTLNYKSFSKTSNEVIEAGNLFKYSVIICNNSPKYALETCGGPTEVITKNIAFGKLSLNLVGSPDVDNDNNVSYSITWASNNLVGYNFILQWSTSNSTNDVDWQTVYSGKNNTADTKSLKLMPKLKNSFYYRFKACKTETNCSEYSDVLEVYVPPIIANPDQLITITPYHVRFSNIGSHDGDYNVIITKIAGLEDSNYILEESQIKWLSNNSSETVWRSVWDSKTTVWGSNSSYNPKKENKPYYYEKLLNANNANVDNSDNILIKYRVKLCKNEVCDVVKNKDNQDLEQNVYIFPTSLPFYEASVGKNSDVSIDLYDVSPSNNVLDNNGNISSYLRYDLVWFTSEKSVTEITNKQTNFIKTPNYSNMLTWYSAGSVNGPKCFVDNSENVINSHKSCSLSTNSPKINDSGNKFNFSFSKFYKENPQYFGYAIRSCVGVVCSNWATSKVVSFELPVPTFTSGTWQINNNLSTNWSSTQYYVTLTANSVAGSIPWASYSGSSLNWGSANYVTLTTNSTAGSLLWTSYSKTYSNTNYVTIATNSTSGSIAWTSYSDTSLSLKFEKCDKASNPVNCQQLTTLFYSSSIIVNPLSDTDYKVQVCGNKSLTEKICGAWSILNIKGEFSKDKNFVISVKGTNVKPISATSYNSGDGSFIIEWGNIPFTKEYNILWTTNKNAPESDWIKIAGLTGLFKDFDLLKGKVTYNYKVQACATADTCSNWSQVISVNVYLNTPIFNDTIKLQNARTIGTTTFKWTTTGIATIPEVVILDTKWGTGKGVNLTISWQSIGNAASYQVCQLVNGKNSNSWQSIGSAATYGIINSCTLQKDFISFTSTSFSTLKEAGSTYSYYIRSCNVVNTELQSNTTCGNWSAYPLTIVVPYATPKLKVDEEICINTLGEKVICKENDNIYVTFDNTYNIWGSLSGYEYPLSYQLGQISNRGNYTWKSVSFPINLRNEVSADFELTTTNSNTIKYALRTCSIPTEYNLSLKSEVDNRSCSNFIELSVVYTKLESGKITIEKIKNIPKLNFDLNTNTQETDWCRPNCFPQLATLKYSSVIGGKYYQIYYYDAGEDNNCNLINGDDCNTTWQTLSKTFNGANFEIDKNTFYNPNRYIYFKIKNCSDVNCLYSSNFSEVYGVYTLADIDGNGLIEIYTIEDLNNIRYNLAGTSLKTSETDPGISVGCPNKICIGYELKANLDFNNTRWSSNYTGADKVANGWLPLGDDTTPYSASFNGNGFEIKNLFIYSDNFNYAGLFGKVLSKNGISNIGVTNFWISFTSSNDNIYSGGLVGWMSGSITNSYATGSSSSYSSSYNLSSYSGGLVGWMSGSITNSYATGSSSSNNLYSYSGGLVGNIQGGAITNSYATGSSSSSSNLYSYSGGLVGNIQGGAITNSYATGSSSSSSNLYSYSGGLVGNMQGGGISNSYATGSSSATGSNSSYSGGLVGSMSVGWISNSYATGSSSSSSTYSGGLVGYKVSGSSISNSFWNKDSDQIVNGIKRGTTGNPAKLGIGSDTSSNGSITGLTPLSTYDLQATSGSITGLGTTAFDFIGNGNYPKLCVTPLRVDKTKCTLPDYIENVLSGNDRYSTVADHDGNGLIEIYTIEDLNNIRYNLNGTSRKISNEDPGNNNGCPSNGCIGYELKNDLDFNNTKWARNCTGSCASDGWAPIGTYSTPFTAKLDGKGFEIHNLYINRPTQDYVGLFGYISTTSTLINNVGVVNAYVEGNNYTGGLVGYQSGTITNSYASGTVSGDDYTGGLVGYQNSGTSVTNSYASGSVIGNYYTGGLVGYQSGGSSVTNSYGSGSVSGYTITGGLVGWLNGSIINCYASGSVSGRGGANTGGLVGYQSGGSSVTNSYASGSVSGYSYNTGGLVGYQSGGSSVTNSYASGTVSGKTYTGGLVGQQNNGTITNSYASGSVSGNNSDTGGLVGYQSGGTSVTNSYFVSDKGTNGIGNGTCTNTNCIKLNIEDILTLNTPILKSSFTTVNWDAKSRAGNGHIALLGTDGIRLAGQGWTTNFDTVIVFKQNPFSDYTKLLFVNKGSAFNLPSTYIDAGIIISDGLTFLGWSTDIPYSLSDNNTLTGTYSIPNSSSRILTFYPVYNIAEIPQIAGEDGLIWISTAASLYNIRYSPKGTYYQNGPNGYKNTKGCPANGCRGYKLLNNIDFNTDSTAINWSSNMNIGVANSGWEPIGTDITPFTATFDGKGFEIRNLYINKPTKDYVGLFGYVSGTSTLIKSIGVVNAYVKGNSYVGGLLGYQNGGSSVTNSYASGLVSGAGSTGGLVGWQNSGNITNSYASGNVSGSTNTGELGWGAK